jgi:multicomponent Na+:H+ antiporter subunit D
MTEAGLLLHPAGALLAGAVLVAATRGVLRAALALLAPAVAVALALLVPDGSVHGQLLGHAVVPFAVDALSRLFATVFALMALCGALFALHQPSRLELPAAFVYAGAAIGVACAGDLLTLFVHWEVMAIGSTLVLWSAGTRAGLRAGLRYLMVHLFGGVLLLAGVAGHALDTGSLLFGPLPLDGVAHWLILAGFLVNAGAPPLSAWLADAYPRASWSGMVFLSAFTTKAAVYALMRGFPGADILVYVGLAMVFYGIVYALLENDMRRILAYSIVNQVGFMVTGIGIGTTLALNGAAAHAFAHILYKALLLMSAGSVLYMTGRRKCTDLGGLYRSMPVTTLCGIVGALAISSFPLTNGFVSKSMIGQAAAEQHLFAVWLLLAAASAGVFLHAGIKFPWFVFFQRDSGLRPPDPPVNMRLAMLLLSLLCVGLGVLYEPLYALLPYPVEYEPYTGPHVVAQLQLLLFSGLAFFVMLRWLRRTLTITLDVDWFYRRLFPAGIARLEPLLAAARAQLAAGFTTAATRAWQWAQRAHGPGSRLASTWPAGSMALWMMVMLLALLLAGYLG